MPLVGHGMMPVFYFLMATHDEPAFRICLNKFIYDAKKLRDQTPAYHRKSFIPRQCICDMSLVIFRPCLGRFYIRF